MTIRNVTARSATQIGMLISGIPGHPIRDVLLQNIDLELAGGGRAEDAQTQFAENERAYPEIHMFGPSMPAYGIYARHVSGIRFDNVRTTAVQPDARPANAFVDVQGMTPADFASTQPAR